MATDAVDVQFLESSGPSAPAKKQAMAATVKDVHGVAVEEQKEEISSIDKYYNQVQEAAADIRRRIANKYNDAGIFKIATVLGSGLGAFADELADKVYIPYDQIPNFPKSTVEGHAGRMVIGRIGHRPLIVMQGRVHYYEGYTMKEVVFPIRVLGALGVQLIVMTNAAGGVNFDFKVGDIMVIKDHINNLWNNPLHGPNDKRFGPRFPDMSNAYSKELRPFMHQAARAMGETLQEGVYCANTGPNYETPAETRLVRMFGADAVGMSTVPECIAANHMGVKVVGMSLITNAACGVTDQPLSHEEVKETGAARAAVLCSFLSELVQSMALMTQKSIPVLAYDALSAEAVKGLGVGCFIVSGVPELETRRAAALSSGDGKAVTETLQQVGAKAFPGRFTDEYAFSTKASGSFTAKTARVCASPAFPSDDKSNWLAKNPVAGYSVKTGSAAGVKMSYPLVGLPSGCALVFCGPESGLEPVEGSFEAAGAAAVAFSVEC